MQYRIITQKPDEVTILLSDNYKKYSSLFSLFLLVNLSLNCLIQRHNIGDCLILKNNGLLRLYISHLPPIMQVNLNAPKSFVPYSGSDPVASWHTSLLPVALSQSQYHLPKNWTDHPKHFQFYTNLFPAFYPN